MGNGRVVDARRLTRSLHKASRDANRAAATLEQAIDAGEVPDRAGVYTLAPGEPLDEEELVEFVRVAQSPGQGLLITVQAITPSPEGA